MSANQCGRAHGLGTTKIYERYSVCSFRAAAAQACCTNPVQGYQCWSFCAVAEADFQTWFSCAEKLNATRDHSGGLEARCQRADESPLLKEKGPYPKSFVGPYTPDWVYSDQSSLRGHLYPSGVGMARAMGPANATATPTSTVADKKVQSNSLAPTATEARKSGSVKALQFSIGGLMCAILAVPTLIL